jgi:iron complex transport system ATP-binding protein
MSGERLLLEVEALRFGYPARPLLHGVDLALGRGELLALLGTNGSGKTTLLRLISGLLRPEAGEVRVAGRPVAAWRRDELARRLAVLPQRLELPAGFRVAELVEMGRAPHASRLFGSTPEDAAAVERALVDADAVELADRMADELSGGERQRVLVAMALAQEPQLLLLDEPTLHLDVAHRVALLGTITRLQRSRGIGVLAVLHDLDLAAAFAPRVALLHEGRILADGSAEEVLRGELLRRVFGVAIDEAFTADGRRHLVPHIGAARVGAD